MRIGIDGTTLVGKRAGVGRYVFELCRALDAQLPKADFYVYSHEPIEMPIQSSRWHSRVEKSPWASRLKSLLWLKIRAGNLCKTDQLDVFWACGTFLPILSPAVKTIATVYDFNVRLVPKTMKFAPYLIYRLFFERDLRHADKLLTISKGTAQRLFELYSLSSVGVVLPAVSTDFRPPGLQAVKDTLKKYNLDRPYILAVGTLEPRKNLIFLIDVFLKLKQMGRIRHHQLVLVGGQGWNDRVLSKRLAQHVGSGIVPLGYVSDADLPCLYAGSEAFVFPSIYEGFGMPVAEARACGARIIATDIPEIREAGGHGPLYIPPTIEALFTALESLEQTPEVELSLNPTHRWSDGAETLAKVINDLVSPC